MNKSESALIEKAVSEKITKHFSDKPKFVLGVSGGMDSMALLFALKSLNSDVFVVHINYGLRGEESDKDQELVEGSSFEWGFECCAVRLNADDSENKNFQNWARKERYRVFDELASEIKADAIVVAHHKNDQIETIIQKIFRGSGPNTWTGMSEWDGKIFRPLVNVTKEELEHYCVNNSIPYRTDQSNLESKYARNFIRQELSEKMNNLFPGWEENILKLQEFGRMNENALNALSGKSFTDNKLNIQEVMSLDKSVGHSVMKKFIEQYSHKISKGIIEEAYNLMFAETGSELEISSSLKLIKDRGYITASTNVERFKQQVLTKTQLLDGIKVGYLEVGISSEIQSDLYLDIENLKFPLTIRTWNAGDKIQPLGMSGTQKISDHLTNRKVPSSQKEKSLVLTGTDGTIYAIIFDGKNRRTGTISEISKATESTKQYLSITSKKNA